MPRALLQRLVGRPVAEPPEALQGLRDVHGAQAREGGAALLPGGPEEGPLDLGDGLPRSAGPRRAAPRRPRWAGEPPAARLSEGPDSQREVPGLGGAGGRQGASPVRERGSQRPALCPQRALTPAPAAPAASAAVAQLLHQVLPPPGRVGHVLGVHLDGRPLGPPEHGRAGGVPGPPAGGDRKSVV